MINTIHNRKGVLMNDADIPPSELTFESDFKNMVHSDAEKSLPLPKPVKSPKSNAAKASLIISIILTVLLITAGTTFLANPDISDMFTSSYNNHEIQNLQNEVDKLREQESKILYEEGFSEQYYAALETTSQVAEKQYNIQDSPDPNRNIVIIIAIVSFIMATITLTIGLVLFIKL